MSRWTDRDKSDFRDLVSAIRAGRRYDAPPSAPPPSNGHADDAQAMLFK